MRPATVAPFPYYGDSTVEVWNPGRPSLQSYPVPFVGPRFHLYPEGQTGTEDNPGEWRVIVTDRQWIDVEGYAEEGVAYAPTPADAMQEACAFVREVENLYLPWNAYYYTGTNAGANNRANTVA